jgi:hypothetical protein
MGDVFVLKDPVDPLTVHVDTVRGVSGTVHLTDDRTVTLCGRHGRLTLAQPGLPATCKLCLGALNGKPRIRRLFR